MRDDSSDTDPRIIKAKRLFDAGAGADNSPARDYLTGRMCWPPQVPLPADVRWITAKDALQFNATPPANATGCVVYGFRDAEGSIKAVQLESLNGAGVRLVKWPAAPSGAKRLTIGPISQTAFRVEGKGAVVAVAEGPTTAMAASWHCGRVPCRASGGSMISAPSLWGDAKAILVIADADRAGLMRSQKVLTQAAGGNVRVLSTICPEPGFGDIEDMVRARIERSITGGLTLEAAWEELGVRGEES